MPIHTLIILIVVLLASCATRFVPATKTRQCVLLIASYFVYAHLAGSAFLVLLVASSFLNYLWGTLLRRRPRTALLWTAIGSNVLLLAFFKYLPSLITAWPGAFAEFDFVQRIVLPLGVSFWTFQAISYLCDTYLEEDLDPTLPEFCLYMAFWPTVTSGPVCRLTKMLPRFRRLPGPIREDYPIGVVRLIQGLFMKLVLAQLLADGVTPQGGVTAGFDATTVQRNGLDVWALAIGFGFQLFFDFAGYSHIVIGAARLVGIQLEENFNRPYLAKTPAVFWTRWHMSLSFWIRDYVYLPLSTLRRNQSWHYAVLVISMATFGFWHGAKLTLILWGIYHGILLVLHRLGQQLTRAIPYRLPDPLGPLLSWGTTFSLVCLSYVFFRANNLSQALQMLQAVISPGSYSPSQSTLGRDYYVLVALLVVSYFALVWLGQLPQLLKSYTTRNLRPYSVSFDAGGSPRMLTGAFITISDTVSTLRWWLLAPVLAFLLLATGLRFFGDSSAIAPFAYALF